MITSLLELEELANCKRCDEASIIEELRVCVGSSCLSLGADEIEQKLKNSMEYEKALLQKKVWQMLIWSQKLSI